MVNARRILNRAMAQSAEDRYASASDFRDALRRVGRVGIVGPNHPLSNDGGRNQRTLDHAEVPASRSVSDEESDGFSLPAGKKRKNHGLLMIAAVVIVLFASIFASVYRSYSQQGESSTVKTVTSSSNSAALPTTSTRGSKADRSSNHRNEDANTSIADSSNSASNRIPQESPTVTNPPLQASNLRQGSADNSSHSQLSSRFERPHLPAPREPNVRFPNLAVQQSYPTQGARFSPPELRPGNMPTVAISSTSNVPAEIREAQVLRARDGTQIVKFSDGTTRVFRPGERSAHSNTAPR